MSCGVESRFGELAQYQLPDDEGWTISAKGSFVCNDKVTHLNVHIQSGFGWLVSWPWEDIGNGVGIWKDTGEEFPAMWSTDKPPVPVADVVRRLK